MGEVLVHHGDSGEDDGVNVGVGVGRRVEPACCKINKTCDSLSMLP